MTNKIVILQNSVELYEHYINDEKWEKTLSFPKGGLTYNISNGTIKFFAFEDYLYRNCLMSMQLPIYIVDEKDGIDDEYSDIGEIVDILDEIFPTNDIDAELEGYLTKREAEITYQPIGDYVTTYELDEVLDEYYTKDETDDLLDGKADKDDVYTKDEADSKYQVKLVAGDNITIEDNVISSDVDLTNYYTKIEVDNKILSSCTFDPSQYYTKDDSDDRFMLKSDIPQLSGYATTQWVLNQNYVTNSTLNQYITNLQEQINSLTSVISGCCSETGTTIYRWLTMTSPNDFICSGTTKYEKQVYQQSTDGGITWTNVTPAQYQRGNVIATQSSDCGYTPETQYRWKQSSTSDYMCVGTSKYYKEYYQQSTDGGQTWTNVVPEQVRQGSLISTQSTDCGYIGAEYRWYSVPNEYVCCGTTKCEKQVYQQSTDGGVTWTNVVPEQTRRGASMEYNSYDCGYRGCAYCAEVKLTGDSTVYHPYTLVGVYNGKFDSRTSGQGWWYANQEKVMSVALDSCVTEIGSYTFEGWWHMVCVDLPSTITFIGERAFNIASNNFKTLILRAETPPELQDNGSYQQDVNTFRTDYSLKIYVPDRTLNIYKTTNKWSHYADIIYPLSQVDRCCICNS